MFVYILYPDMDLIPLYPHDIPLYPHEMNAWQLQIKTLLWIITLHFIYWPIGSIYTYIYIYIYIYIYTYIYIYIYTFIYIICVKNQHPLTTSVVPMYICATSRFNKALSLLYANRQKARTATAATDWQQAALWFHMVAEQWSWKHPGELQQAEGLIPEHWGTLNNSWSNKG